MPAISLTHSSVFSALDHLLKDVRTSDTLTPAKSTDTESLELNIIETKIQYLALVIEEFRKVANDQLAHYRRRRNLLTSPILQLPNDIISAVLRSSILLDTRIAPLREVCSHFHQVIDSNPRLWSHIVWTEKARVDWTAFQLAKSKAAPLSLDIGSIRDCGDQSIILDMLRHHACRWKIAHFKIDLFERQVSQLAIASSVPGDTMIKCFDEVQAPLLQDFSVTVIQKDHHSLRSRPVNLFQGHAPNIRRLDIRDITISWDNPILSGLTSLSIYAWDGFKTPSAEQYIRLLKSCPGMEVFRLDGQGLGFGLAEAAAFHSHICLPRLTLLELKNIHPLTIRSILLSVKASPGRVRIDIPIEHLDQGRDALTTVLHDVENSILSSICISPNMLMIMHNSFGVNSTRDDGSSLKLDCTFKNNRSGMAVGPGVDVLRLVPLLLPPSCRAKVHGLDIGSRLDLQSETYTLRQLLEDLTELREIRCDQLGVDGTTALKVIEILSEPVRSSPNETPRWLCHHLSRLRVSISDDDLDAVFGFTKSRYQQASGWHPTKLVCMHVSRPLLYINAAARIEDPAADIAEIVGNQVLVRTSHNAVMNAFCDIGW